MCLRYYAEYLRHIVCITLRSKLQCGQGATPLIGHIDPKIKNSSISLNAKKTIRIYNANRKKLLLLKTKELKCHNRHN